MRRRFQLCVLALAVASAGTARAQPAVPPFQVEVTLSRKAAARLAALHEGITVSATFYGRPTPAARRQADQMGQIELGDEEITIAGPGTVTITGRAVAAAKLGLVLNRAPQVLINVYSARRSDANNLLDCGIFEDAVALAASGPVRIACKLIAEGS